MMNSRRKSLSAKRKSISIKTKIADDDKENYKEIDLNQNPFVSREKLAHTPQKGNLSCTIDAKVQEIENTQRIIKPTLELVSHVDTPRFSPHLSVPYSNSQSPFPTSAKKLTSSKKLKSDETNVPNNRECVDNEMFVQTIDIPALCELPIVVNKLIIENCSRVEEDPLQHLAVSLENEKKLSAEVNLQLSPEINNNNNNEVLITEVPTSHDEKEQEEREDDTQFAALEEEEEEEEEEGNYSSIHATDITTSSEIETYDKLSIDEVLQAFREDAAAAESAIEKASVNGKLYPKEFREILKAFRSPPNKRASIVLCNEALEMNSDENLEIASVKSQPEISSTLVNTEQTTERVAKVSSTIVAPFSKPIRTNSIVAASTISKKQQKCFNSSTFVSSSLCSVPTLDCNKNQSLDTVTSTSNNNAENPFLARKKLAHTPPKVLEVPQSINNPSNIVSNAVEECNVIQTNEQLLNLKSPSPLDSAIVVDEKEKFSDVAFNKSIVAKADSPIKIVASEDNKEKLATLSANELVVDISSQESTGLEWTAVELDRASAAIRRVSLGSSAAEFLQVEISRLRQEMSSQHEQFEKVLIAERQDFANKLGGIEEKLHLANSEISMVKMEAQKKINELENSRIQAELEATKESLDRLEASKKMFAERRLLRQENLKRYDEEVEAARCYFESKKANRLEQPNFELCLNSEGNMEKEIESTIEPLIIGLEVHHKPTKEDLKSNLKSNSLFLSPSAHAPFKSSKQQLIPSNECAFFAPVAIKKSSQTTYTPSTQNKNVSFDNGNNIEDFGGDIFFNATASESPIPQMNDDDDDGFNIHNINDDSMVSIHNGNDEIPEMNEIKSSPSKFTKNVALKTSKKRISNFQDQQDAEEVIVIGNSKFSSKSFGNLRLVPFASLQSRDQKSSKALPKAPDFVVDAIESDVERVEKEKNGEKKRSKNKRDNSVESSEVNDNREKKISSKIKITKSSKRKIKSDENESINKKNKSKKVDSIASIDLKVKSKAPSAFIYFSSAMRPELRSVHPTASMPEIAKQLGAQWKELTADDKKKWAIKAKESTSSSIGRDLQEVVEKNVPDFVELVSETIPARNSKSKSKINNTENSKVSHNKKKDKKKTKKEKEDSISDSETLEKEIIDEKNSAASTNAAESVNARTGFISPEVVSLQIEKTQDRAPSALVMYSSSVRDEVVKDYPSERPAAIAKIIQSMWKNLSAHEKKGWVDQQNKTQHKHSTSCKKVKKKNDIDIAAEKVETNETDELQATLGNKKNKRKRQLENANVDNSEIDRTIITKKNGVKKEEAVLESMQNGKKIKTNKITSSKLLSVDSMYSTSRKTSKDKVETNLPTSLTLLSPVLASNDDQNDERDFCVDLDVDDQFNSSSPIQNIKKRKQSNHVDAKGEKKVKKTKSSKTSSSSSKVASKNKEEVKLATAAVILPEKEDILMPPPMLPTFLKSNPIQGDDNEKTSMPEKKVVSSNNSFLSSPNLNASVSTIASVMSNQSKKKFTVPVLKKKQI